MCNIIVMEEYYDIRDRPVPNLKNDGEFVKPLTVETSLDPGKIWHEGLNAWQRLNSHYTYSSVRRHVHFKPFRMIRDQLDFVLASTYEHNKELFPDKIDVYLQPVTLGFPSSKTGDQNVIHAKESKDFDGTASVTKYNEEFENGPRRIFGSVKAQREYILSHRYCSNHPLIIGGIKKRVHPSSVKLINSSHHSPQTNAGYVRQDRDGTLFQY